MNCSKSIVNYVIESDCFFGCVFYICHYLVSLLIQVLLIHNICRYKTYAGMYNVDVLTTFKREHYYVFMSKEM